MSDDEVVDRLYINVTDWVLSSFKVKKRLANDTIPEYITRKVSGVVQTFLVDNVSVGTDLSWWQSYRNVRWYVGSHLAEIDCLEVTSRILEEL